MSKYFEETLSEIIIKNIEKESIQTEKIDLINSYCDDIDDHINLLKKIDKSIKENSLNFPISDDLDFVVTDPNDSVQQQREARRLTDYDTIINFIGMTEKISSKFSRVNNQSWTKLQRLLPNDDFKTVYDEAVEIIRKHVQDFFDRYLRDNLGPNDFRLSKLIGNINEEIKDLTIMIQSLIFLIVSISIETTFCRLINVVGVELGTTKNEVIDFPNYTLVLPLEVVLSLYSAYISTNIRQLEDLNFPTANKRNVIGLDSNYIKGMVEYLTVKLAIPNIIIVDEKTSTVFYKFMNMSRVNNTKLSTMDAFVKAYDHSKDTISLYSNF